MTLPLVSSFLRLRDVSTSSMSASSPEDSPKSSSSAIVQRDEGERWTGGLSVAAVEFESRRVISAAQSMYLRGCECVADEIEYVNDK